MNAKDLKSIGILEEHSELFSKVKSILDRMDAEDYVKDPDLVYEACKKSGKFTPSELKILSSTYATSPTQKLINAIVQAIKQFLKK